MTPLLLHLETATEVCSVCISRGTEELARQTLTEAYQHAARLTLLIEAATREAGVELSQLDAVALSQGPGSYTSLRVGTSTGKGICYALDKPLIAIDTLQAMALASRRAEDPAGMQYAPMIDARRMEVYTARFDGAGQRLRPTEAKIIDEQSYAEQWADGQALVFSGNGAAKCQSVLTNPLAHFRSVDQSAHHLIPLAVAAFSEGRFADLAYFSPEYFKSPNITQPKNIW